MPYRIGSKGAQRPFKIEHPVTFVKVKPSVHRLKTKTAKESCGYGLWLMANITNHVKFRVMSRTEMCHVGLLLALMVKAKETL